jgi:hypothetical protein
MKETATENLAPPVNISKNLRRSSLRVGRPDILLNPVDDVILECTFDNLVQEVW